MKKQIFFCFALMLMILTSGIVFADSGGPETDSSAIVLCDNPDSIILNPEKEKIAIPANTKEGVLYNDSGGDILVQNEKCYNYLNDFQTNIIITALCGQTVKPDFHLLL